MNRIFKNTFKSKSKESFAYAFRLFSVAENYDDSVIFEIHKTKMC